MSQSMGLWDWWEQPLTDQRRQRLLAEADVNLQPDLALERWRSSGRRAVEPETWTVDADPLRWRLTAEAAEFVHQRRYERVHPQN